MALVLLVGDDAAALEDASRFLEQTGGLLVRTVLSVPEAEEILGRSSFDAIVSDHRMPALDGLSLLRRLREAGDTTPFIFFTDNREEELVIGALNAGASYFVLRDGDESSSLEELKIVVDYTIANAGEAGRLRQRADQYRDLTESISDLYFAMDRELRYTFWNRASEVFMGISAEEAIGKSLYDLFPGSEGSQADKVYREVIASGRTKSFLNKFQKGGDQYYFNIYVYPVTGGIAVLARDITRSHELESLLKRSEERYRYLLDHANDQILIHEVTPEYRPGRILEANSRVVQALGYTKEELQMMSIDDIAVIRNPEEMARTGEELIRTGSSVFEGLERTKDGRTILVEISSNIVAEDGTLTSITIIRDISERKRAEEELRSSEERYRLVSENIPVVVYSALPDEQSTTFFISGRSRELTGYSEDDYLAEPALWESIIHHEDRERVKIALDEVQKTGSSFDLEYRVVTRDGPVKWIRDVARPSLDDQGHVTRLDGYMEDITRQRSAEERLRLTQFTVDRATESIFWIRPDGSFVYVNDYACQLLGYTREELLGMSVDRIDPNYPKEKRAGIWEKLKETGSFTIETVHQARDGAAIPVEVNANYIRYGGEEYEVVWARNIADRKKAEEVLKESEERYRLLVENINDVIFTLDASGIIRYISPSVTELGGYLPEEIVGMSFHDFIHPDDQSEVGKSFQRMITGIIDTSIYRVRAKGGRYIVARSSAKPIIKDGKVTGLSGVLVDITDTVRAQEALEESETKYREIFEHAVEGIFQSTPEGRYITVNPAFARMAGYSSPKEMVNGVADISTLYLHPEERNVVKSIFEDVGRVINYEMQIRSTDGIIRWIIINAHVVKDASGRLLYYEGTTQDITERKRAELALQEANRKLNLLSSITRHDILNQINALQGYLTLLTMEIPDECARKEYVTSLMEITSRIERQISFTRDYQDLGVKEPSWQDPLPLIRQCMSMESGKDGSVSTAVEMPAVELFADQMLGKVFCNLIQNAFRHAEGMTLLDFSAHEEEGQLVIIIEDDGCGIAEDRKEEIFQPGFGRDHGYGLYLVSEILSITGIGIAETGEAGCGARFELRVPPDSWRSRTGD